MAGDVLVTRDRGYLLRVDREHLDAARFQDGFTAGRAALDAGRYAEAAGTLRQALGLWRSGVLADLADYAFVRPEAARLEELRLAALEARIDADLALGRHDTLIGELERLAASCRSSHESPTSNWAEFCDPRVDQLTSEAQAAQVTDPATARRMWAQADRIATNQAPYVPVYDQASAAFVSPRVGNYQDSPGYGPLLDQMWVR